MDALARTNRAFTGGRCTCHHCDDERRAKETDPMKKMMRLFIVCETCGNKRCPKATDHDLACTGSNASGQPGSVYQ